ncbi:ZNRD1 (predicted) [Pycnogonum litorale]
MMMESNFTGDIDFCPDCGTILALPGTEDYVKCKTCNLRIEISAFDGITVRSKVEFNLKEDKNSSLNFKVNKSSGPLVDRKCIRCGHEGMTFATLQTRSVDEGQTVFYSCPECKFQENENS